MSGISRSFLRSVGLRLRYIAGHIHHAAVKVPTAMPPAIDAPYAARILFLALACFASAWLGLAVSQGATPAALLWLPSGVALAALLRGGKRLWPGAFLGFFLVHAWVSSSWASSLFLAAGDTLGVLLAAWGLGRAGFHA